MEDIKQVILMRTDLNMRKGKMVAQGAHASMKVILDMMKYTDRNEIINYEGTVYYGKMTKRTLVLRELSDINKWLSDKFTKICVGVESKTQLMMCMLQAEVMGLPRAIIEDEGLTEFNGQPTITCAAIGPARSESIDYITGKLKLL